MHNKGFDAALKTIEFVWLSFDVTSYLFLECEQRNTWILRATEYILQKQAFICESDWWNQGSLFAFDISNNGDIIVYNP